MPKPDLSKLLFHDAHKQFAKEDEKIIRQAKKLDDLVIPVLCKIKGVLGVTSEGTDYVDQYVLGTKSISTGYHPEFQLHIDYVDFPQDKGKLEIIKFQGWPPIFNGDMIRAYIFVGEKKTLHNSEHKERKGLIFVKHEGSSSGFSTFSTPYVYFQRAFKKEEEALRIEKLAGNKVLAAYLNQDLFPENSQYWQKSKLVLP